MRAGGMMAATAIAAGAAAIVATGLASAPAVAAPPARDGGALFKQRCAACHSGTTSQIGPNLAGVVGRKAAATGFRYSPALKASGLTWTRPNLDRYLSGPMQMVPGTRMVIRVADPADRAAIVDYLAHAR